MRYLTRRNILTLAPAMGACLLAPQRVHAASIATINAGGPAASPFTADANYTGGTVARAIAHAAQTFGFVIWDKAGALSLRAQNPKSYTQLGQADPYVALFNGTPAYAILNNFPWDKLQFLPMNYGQP